VARATRVTTTIRLDGVLDEPAWLTADSITDFTQQEPDEGRPGTERTVVRILTTEEGIYLGFWLYQAPERVVRSQLRRDADLESDDFVAFLFDPQRDHRSAYAFAVNANGAMSDGEVKGDDADANWNGVWDARARVTAEGWVAEAFVPWQTLRYPREGEAWGLNLFRLLRGRNEYLVWRSWQRQLGFFYLPGEGELEGLGPLPRRRLLEARPYLSSTGALAERRYLADETDSVVEASDADLALGVDAKVALAGTLTLDLTTHTDFAQVDADRQVVNLTRFPLFFPEKRGFFLESSGIFDFGQSERTQLFHSRRIGLDEDGRLVPIDAGARLSGRVGAERIGLLAVRTGGAENAVDLVARVKHDVFARGFVGAMATAQGGPGVDGERLAYGADFNFPLLLHGQNIVPAAFLAWSRDSSGAPARSAWRVFLDYPNDRWDNFVAVSRIERGFDPALGFVRQDGVWRYTAAVRVSPRPHIRGVRNLSFKPFEFDVSTNLDGALNNGFLEVRPFGFRTVAGDEVELNLQRFADVPADTFEIFPGTNVLPGRYEWNRVEVNFSGSSARPVGLDLGVSVGDYYTGTGTEVQVGLTVRAAPHVIAALEGGTQIVRLATGRFTTRVGRLRLDYAANPRLNTTAFIQYDNESGRLAVNARLHWIPQPGSDAYLVWNSAWPTGLSRGIPWGKPLRGSLVGKLVYYFRV
jgi:hypothetical protein